MSELYCGAWCDDCEDDEEIPEAGWHVIWTKSNREKIVAHELADKGFECFLPMVDQWSKRAGSRHAIRVPLFRGYLFVRNGITKRSYLRICQTRGLVRILGHSWDRLATVPCHEIESIRKAVDSDAPVSPHPYVKEGDRVRIVRGSLAGIEGIFVKSESSGGVFVLSIELLRRSVAVEIDCTDVQVM